MSRTSKFDEQSMEEILASIRSSVDTPAEPPPPPGPGSAATSNVGSSVPPTAPRSQSNGTGRLQDALSQIAAAQSSQPAPSATEVKLGVPSMSAPKPPGLPQQGMAHDDDLSDLFEDRGAAKSVTPPDAARSAPTPFGAAIDPTSQTTKADPPSPASPSAASQSEPVAKQSAVGAAPQAAAPQVVVPAATPEPKRVPNFDALNSLATGSPPQSNNVAEASQTPAADSQKNASVLLPEMRDMADSNPVAQMHSLVKKVSESPADDAAQSEPTGDGAQAASPDVNNLAAADTATPKVKTPPVRDDVPREPPNMNTMSMAAAKPNGAVSKPGRDTDPSDVSQAGSRSLEDIVVELLKPQLQTWLEANMPRIVERALRAEQTKDPSDSSSS